MVKVPGLATGIGSGFAPVNQKPIPARPTITSSYNTIDQVLDAYVKGRITAERAAEILEVQFGLSQRAAVQAVYDAHLAGSQLQQAIDEAAEQFREGLEGAFQPGIQTPDPEPEPEPEPEPQIKVEDEPEPINFIPIIGLIAILGIGALVFNKGE